jgi:iron(III) transport system substrate-binding protein
MFQKVSRKQNNSVLIKMKKGAKKMFKKILISAAPAALAALVAVPSMVYGSDATAADVQVAQSSEWKALVRAAKREGKVELILGGQMPRKLRKIMPEFTKKYGIKVNAQTGSSRRHAARILAERKSGKYTADVWIGGANSGLSILLPNKMIQPVDNLLIDPEVKNPKRWYQGKHHYTDPKGRYIFTWGASPAYVIAINTNMVKADEIQSYWDLLKPKWKGKIVARSPARRGSGASSVPMLLNPQIGEKWFTKFATEMDVTITRDSRQGAEWLALGRYAIGMFGINNPSVKLAREGFPVKPYLPQILKEGEILSASAANIMSVSKPANPKAAQLFINWALSKEGQSIFIKTGETSDSMRVDVDKNLIAKQYWIRPDRKYYVAFSDPKFINNQRKLLKKLRKIMKKGRKKRKK